MTTNQSHTNIIKNKDQLATTTSRQKAISIIEAGISCVLPSSIMHSSLKFDKQNQKLTVNNHKIDLTHGRVFVVGGGKAGVVMARSLEQILDSANICAGIVTDKYGVDDISTEKISIVLAGHPVPDNNGVQAVQAMLQMKTRYQISEKDIVICLISGGGSALMPCPVDEITLEDKQQVTRLLLESGAEISDINCVRKHLSKVKGGQLGRYFSPATVVSLILSDVIGNDLSVIASGPTYPDKSTFFQAITVIQNYNLLSRIPLSVRKHLEDGISGIVKDTPKKLDNCYNFIIGDNSLALEAMRIKALQLNLHPLVISAEQKGDTRKVAEKYADAISSGKYSGYDTLIIGGETTPRLPEKHGQGGRNQHYTAVSVLALEKYKTPWLVASIGTDGSDYMSGVAGALVDESTLALLKEHKIDVEAYIDNFNSYGLLSQLENSIIRTGNTGTNVGDIMVYILG
jgi:hydroxypyruvate reductase/glycerate 2-kinase